MTPGALIEAMKTDTDPQFKKNVLVIGCRGLLGGELMRRFSSGAVKGVDVDSCDITRSNQIAAVFNESDPDLVINTAAYTDVDGCESDRERAWQVNAIGPANLARICRERDIPLIQISTDFVFSGRKNTPYRVDDDPEPISVYGSSKLGGEQAVQKSGVRHLIVRTSWLFGKGGKNFIDTILAASRSRDSLSVVSDQVGAPTSAVDLAGALEKLIRADASGIVHFSNRGSCSWDEYARFILRTAGKATRVLPVSSSCLDRPASRPSYSVLDLSRYRDLTGQLPRLWQEAVREYLAEAGCS